ncbi:MAG TPA: tRNA (N(6)-L-threonylcarbamoyladenosine(37)-C(2))-methylthiotransferase MtaB [Candidatus Avacidaminococcus intestinavium]|uniref:Threonylcarbamoyladenosine tRNA methylthiotransferase MtaB n=1 Tax=Candidatus Avacidaminococcus intestinavium TaxID=2840684 RepID=A0A9D1SKP5_9FIRM|nr:tRNA (N(6)-L-threonylcarbamoyladenosine(37)-C(2))-methylthiotransferase MtaB [Candidatus Avacidaminococcus intestinavium]
MSKIAFYTLGCKVNQSDTASMEKLFRTAGYQVVDFAKEADIYVINTCVVTNMGQRKSRQVIHRAIRKNPQALVVVTGCYPQTAAEEVRAIPGVDLIIGNQERASVVDLVQKAGAKRVDTLDAVRKLDRHTAFEELAADSETGKTRAFLKIQEGCNQFCTFCIIPYARGPLRSRSLKNIKEEVMRLVAAGFKEVVLIGIHLGAYGKEDANNYTLTDAVRAALSVEGLERLRLGSLESVEVEDDLLDLMVKDQRIQRQLHLPLQAGTDEILHSMHRPYTTEVFSALLRKIRSKLPDVAITTDLIVGFPGETDELFAEGKKFIEQCAFSKMHIFPFSARKGTPAATFPMVVDEQTKQARAATLAKLDEASQVRFCKNLCGSELSVLFEQENNTGIWEGLSGNYVKIYVRSEENLAGQVKTVKTTELFQDGLLGICI